MSRSPGSLDLSQTGNISRARLDQKEEQGLLPRQVQVGTPGARVLGMVEDHLPRVVAIQVDHLPIMDSRLSMEHRELILDSFLVKGGSLDPLGVCLVGGMVGGRGRVGGIRM